jgi:hypothetical protein
LEFATTMLPEATISLVRQPLRWRDEGCECELRSQHLRALAPNVTLITRPAEWLGGAAAGLRFSEDWTGDCSGAIGEAFLLNAQRAQDAHIHVRHARFAAAAPVGTMLQAHIRATRH